MEVKHYGKKITSIALVVALAAGMTAIPASAEQYNSAMSAPNRMSTVQPRTASWTVTGDWVRMRREPSLLGEIIMLLQYGETVYEGTEYSHVEADGYTWVYVYSNRTGWGGWVASAFMDCQDY